MKGTNAAVRILLAQFLNIGGFFYLARLSPNEAFLMMGLSYALLSSFTFVRAPTISRNDFSWHQLLWAIGCIIAYISFILLKLSPVTIVAAQIFAPFSVHLILTANSGLKKMVGFVAPVLFYGLLIAHLEARIAWVASMCAYSGFFLAQIGSRSLAKLCHSTLKNQTIVSSLTCLFLGLSQLMFFGKSFHKPTLGFALMGASFAAVLFAIQFLFLTGARVLKPSVTSFVLSISLPLTVATRTFINGSNVNFILLVLSICPLVICGYDAFIRNR